MTDSYQHSSADYARFVLRERERYGNEGEPTKAEQLASDYLNLVEQLEAAREALTYAETLAYEQKPEWVAMFQEARESSPASEPKP